MKTEIRFHEGLKGSGVVVSVTHGDHRLMFDFGAPFKPDTNIYDGMVKRRNNSKLVDALRLATEFGCGSYLENDVEEEDNGLYTYDRKVCKFDKEVIKNLFDIFSFIYVMQ